MEKTLCGVLLCGMNVQASRLQTNLPVRLMSFVVIRPVVLHQGLAASLPVPTADFHGQSRQTA